MGGWTIDNADAWSEIRRNLWLPTVRRRALRMALVVGSVLVAINYGDRLLAGSLGGRDLLKIALTYCVPFCVSAYSSALALASARGAP